MRYCFCLLFSPLLSYSPFRGVERKPTPFGSTNPVSICGSIPATPVGWQLQSNRQCLLPLLPDDSLNVRLKHPTTNQASFSLLGDNNNPCISHSDVHRNPTNVIRLVGCKLCWEGTILSVSQIESTSSWVRNHLMQAERSTKHQVVPDPV